MKWVVSVLNSFTSECEADLLYLLIKAYTIFFIFGQWWNSKVEGRYTRTFWHVSVLSYFIPLKTRLLPLPRKIRLPVCCWQNKLCKWLTRKRMHATLFRCKITRNLWWKQYILGNRNLFKSSQIEVRYFVRYTNVRFGLSIEPQIPVFDKNREPVRSPSHKSYFNRVFCHNCVSQIILQFSVQINCITLVS